MKLYRNWIINEVARAGEHTNERMYVRTHIHTYGTDPLSPRTTLLCERIMKYRSLWPTFSLRSNSGHIHSFIPNFYVALKVQGKLTG